jgi:hypothetical protein
LFEHDLFGKPVPTFPDHALAIQASPEALARAPREKSDLGRRQFAWKRIMVKPIRIGFTFRFREWERRSDKA